MAESEKIHQQEEVLENVTNQGNLTLQEKLFLPLKPHGMTVGNIYLHIEAVEKVIQKRQFRWMGHI